jgi:hypothetical protein
MGVLKPSTSGQVAEEAACASNAAAKMKTRIMIFWDVGGLCEQGQKRNCQIKNPDKTKSRQNCSRPPDHILGLDWSLIIIFEVLRRNLRHREQAKPLAKKLRRRHKRHVISSFVLSNQMT